MFNLPNKTALEEVLYFLLKKVDFSGRIKDFRDCWPILDKKQEQLFKKLAIAWLDDIAKNEPKSQLPRLVPLFTKAFGDKVYKYLLSLSRYALHKQLTSKTLNKKCFQDFVGYPSPGTNVQVALKMLSVLVSKEKSRYALRTKQLVDIQERWENVSEMLVKSYRENSRIIKELSSDLSETTVCKDSDSSSLENLSSSSNVFNPLEDARMAKVHNMVDKFNKCLNEIESNKEIYESILDGSVEKYSLQGNSINIVPDQLMQECENEIIKKEIKSTRIDGSLDLLSVLKLWNISMEQFRNSLKKGEVPDMEILNSKFSHLLQKIKFNAEEFTKLDEHMSKEVIPDLVASTEKYFKLAKEKLLTDETLQPLKIASLSASGLTPLKFPSPSSASSPTNLDINWNDVLSIDTSSKSDLPLGIMTQIKKEVDEAVEQRLHGKRGCRDVDMSKIKFNPERNSSNVKLDDNIDENYFKSSVKKVPKGNEPHKSEFKKPPSCIMKASVRRSITPQTCVPLHNTNAKEKVHNSSQLMGNINSKSLNRRSSLRHLDFASSPFKLSKMKDGHMDILAEMVVDQFLQVPASSSSSSNIHIQDLVTRTLSTPAEDNLTEQELCNASNKAINIFKEDFTTGIPEKIFLGKSKETIIPTLLPSVLKGLEVKIGQKDVDPFEDISPVRSDKESVNVPFKKHNSPMFKISDIFDESPTRESLPFQGLESLQLRRMTASLAELAQTQTPQFPERLRKMRWDCSRNANGIKENLIQTKRDSIFRSSVNAIGEILRDSKLYNLNEESIIESEFVASTPNKDPKLLVDFETPKMPLHRNVPTREAFGVMDWDASPKQESKIQPFVDVNDSTYEKFDNFIPESESFVPDPPSCERRTSKRFQLKTDVFDNELAFDLPKIEESLINTSGSKPHNDSLIDLEGFDDMDLLS